MTMRRHPIITEDCREVIARSPGLWADLDGARVFITGGTGFFGSWLLELLTFATDELGIDCQATVLTRDPARFANSSAGHLAVHSRIRWLAGDVKSFSFPDEPYSHVVHFASTGPKAWHDGDPEGFASLVTDGTRRVLDFSCRCGARRFLLASTGAVYGSGHVEPIPETSPLRPAAGANGRAKASAEQMSLEISRQHPSLGITIARGFSFVGPYLPAGSGFAAHDFLTAAASGKTIVVDGDGTPVRSYLYGSDLALWLWTILLRAEGGTIWNVGSEVPITILKLAQLVADTAGGLSVEVRGRAAAGAAPSWYVPSTRAACQQLGLRQNVSVEAALERTLAWHQSFLVTA